MVTLGLNPARPDGVAGLVPAGAVADFAVVLVGDRLILSPTTNRIVVENLGSMPLADVTVETGVAGELASGATAQRAHRVALDEWMVLTAHALVGMAARSLEIGVDYVKERWAFGAPIGSFQAIGHRLADVAAAVDGARLLANEAAWAADSDPGRAGQLAAMAFAFASETARDMTYWSLHFHGGYGFMLEYDVQLYYRRARAWARVDGESRTAYLRVADCRYGEAHG